eukprot:10995201-Ditylum_brightwellii.AAC.1
MPTQLQLFDMFFPMKYVKGILIPYTNRRFSHGVPELTYGKFLVFIGLWLMMGTIQGFQCRSFWSIAAIDPFEISPYHFDDIMSRHHLSKF